MIEKVYTVTEQGGLHARPASLLVSAASKLNPAINLEYKDKKVNLKSIMGVMSLGIAQGSQIKISVEGENEEETLRTLETTLIKEGLAK
ncbi:phosphocarrier protein HPr [Neobacillus niacini]|uniref:phosphocarrier protein HPr n=1 Tax=Neobacillus niacini TaxID=86668 RepID=UPI003002EF2F